MLLFLCRGLLYRFIPLNPDPNKAGKNWKHFSPLKLLAEKIRPQETLESPQPWSPFSVYVNRKGRKEKHAANRNKSTGLYVAGAGWNPTFTGGLPQAEGSLFLSQGHDGRLYKTDMRFRGAVSAVSGKKVWSCSVSARIPSHHRRSLKKNTDCRSRCCPTRSML